MFQKIQFRLAALCAGITCFILLAMSCGCLYISENGLKNSSFISFQNDMNTIIGNLEQQVVITHEWLNKMENHGKYQIQILDNDTPFLFNERSSEEQQQLFEKAWTLYEEQSVDTSQEESISSRHTEFSFSSKEKKAADYYACAAVSRRNNGSLSMLVLMPLEQLHHQIRAQRIRFLVLDLAALAALILFSWYFTKRLLQPLEESQRQQAQFIASASHELRTPLAVILSCASASRSAEGSRRTHFLNSIQSEGARMSRLIDDLLLLSHADSNSWTIQKEPAELDTLLLNTFESFEPIAAEKKLRLFIDLPEEPFPPCTCDAERIRQVLSILMHNAVSYTPEQGSIRLSLTYDSKTYRLSVIDSGIGIPDEEKPHIFERFYRSDRSRSQKGHFGLGLCIADEILKAHNGQLLVSDTPGGGSTFTVVL